MFGTLKKAVYMHACGSFCGDEELRVPVLRVPTLPPRTKTFNRTGHLPLTCSLDEISTALRTPYFASISSSVYCNIKSINKTILYFSIGKRMSFDVRDERC